MSEQIHWTEYLRALGPMIIAFIVAYIAFERWRMARANFAEKLFDKRFAILDAFRELAIRAIHEDEALGKHRAEANSKLEQSK